MTNINALLSSFSFHGRIDDIDYEISKQLIIDEVVMPAFHTFDEPTPVFRVNVDSTDGVILITVVDENGDSVGGNFPSLENAYDYVQEELKGDVVFSGDLKAVTGEDERDFISIPTKDKKYMRLLLSHTSRDSEYVAKHDYYSFLVLTAEYEANPTDFRTCFYWLDSHPAFWHRYKADTNDWSRSGANGKLWVGVTSGDEGQPLIMLETGSAVEPDRMERYHDLRLDTYTDTYENGIIKLAALVHKFFDVDGSERENVDYEPSPLEKLLKERLEEIHDNSDEPEADPDDTKDES